MFFNYSSVCWPVTYFSESSTLDNSEWSEQPGDSMPCRNSVARRWLCLTNCSNFERKYLFFGNLCTEVWVLSQISFFLGAVFHRKWQPLYAKTTGPVLRESSAGTMYCVRLCTLRNRKAKRYGASSWRCAFQYFLNIFLTVASNYLNAARNNSFHSYTLEEAQGLPHLSSSLKEISCDSHLFHMP